MRVKLAPPVSKLSFPDSVSNRDCNHSFGGRPLTFGSPFPTFGSQKYNQKYGKTEIRVKLAPPVSKLGFPDCVSNRDCNHLFGGRPLTEFVATTIKLKL